MEFPGGADWTYGDSATTLRALALDFTGDATNAVDPNYDRMWVMVEDTAGNRKLSQHPNPSAQVSTVRQTFNVDLDELIDAGVDVTNVQYLYIGFGERCNPNPGTPGGEGTVRIDNIRLHPPRCVGQPGYRQLGDVSGDCTVGLADVKVIANNWLARDRITDGPAVVAGDDPNMVARWEFEGNYLNDANGTAGSLADGKPYGNPELVSVSTDKYSGNVLYLDQDVNEWIDCGPGWGDMNGKSFTLSVWESQETSSDWAYFVGKGEGPYKLQYGFLSFLRDRIHFATHRLGHVPAGTLTNGVWYHVAATWSEDEYAARVYVDGKIGVETIIAEDDKPNRTYNAGAVEPNVAIGAKWDETTDPPGDMVDRFYGYLDDIRIYDRQLSEEEIQYLAGNMAPNYYPLLGPAAQSNIYPSGIRGSEVVDFRDFVMLALEWLESDLWPLGY
jgi:hypothetical protein